MAIAPPLLIVQRLRKKNENVVIAALLYNREIPGIFLLLTGKLALKNN